MYFGVSESGLGKNGLFRRVLKYDCLMPQGLFIC